MKQTAVHMDIMFINVLDFLSLGNGPWVEFRKEPGNPKDHYAVALCKGDEMVGHVLRYISTLCTMYEVQCNCALQFWEGGSI